MALDFIRWRKARGYEIAPFRRPPLAHWMVGHCAEIPDALIYMDPKVWLKCQVLYDPINAKIRQAYGDKDVEGIRAGSREMTEIDHREKLPKMQVYREKDLSDVATLLWQASSRLSDFHSLIAWDLVNTEEADKRAKELAEKPEIASLIAARPQPQPDLLSALPQLLPQLPKPEEAQ